MDKRIVEMCREIDAAAQDAAIDAEMEKNT